MVQGSVPRRQLGDPAPVPAPTSLDNTAEVEFNRVGPSRAAMQEIYVHTVTDENGATTYAVVDGQQRVRTIFGASGSTRTRVRPTVSNWRSLPRIQIGEAQHSIA